MRARKIRVLKIGGSVITDKGEGAFEILKEDAIKDVCRAISENRENLILVHGAGSFGHPHVKRYGLNPLGAAKVHLACLRLSEKFCSFLTEYGVAALPVHPMNFYTRTSSLSALKCDLDYILNALERGFLPVLHGDVIFGSDIEVLSGDEIVVNLAEKLKASRIGFATDVDGVVMDGKVVKKFRAEELAKIKQEGSKKVDVTGGMLNKLENIFGMNHRCEVFIFRGNYSNIRDFLQNRKVGTEVVL